MNFRDLISESLDSLFTSELFSIFDVSIDLFDVVIIGFIVILVSFPVLYLIELSKH